MIQEVEVVEKNSPLATEAQSSRHKIVSIEVVGGFLGGFKIDFSEGLNCIIGGRGSGKTTVLEFLRYALNAIPLAAQASTQQKQFEKLLQSNLGTGRLKVVVQTKEGLTYTVERTVNEEAQIFDEQGEPTEFPLDGILDVEVYSQNQIEEIANTPHFQLDLIDKFVKREIGEAQTQLKSVARDLAHNASEILTLKMKILELSEGQSEIKLLEAKLKTFQSAKGQDAKIIQGEIAKHGQRDKEKRFVSQLSNYADTLLRDLNNIKAPFDSKTASILRDADSEFNQNQNAGLMSKLKQAFSESSAGVEAGLNTSSQALQRFKTAFIDVNTEMDKLHKLQEQQYQDILKKFETEKGKAQEQSQLQKRFNELTEKRKEMEERKKALKTKTDYRRDLLKRLSELRDERWKCRECVAKMLNERLKPEIQITVQPCGERSAYKDMLRESFRGTRTWYSSLVEKIAANVAPTEFNSLIQTGSVQELVNRLDIDSEKAAWLVSELKDTEKIFQIETVEVEDKPSIQLKDGKYKDAASLSIGQKCTTILPILLLGSTNPLLVDQPEDNLDNNFIYETVVKRIEKIKKERQMIFVTHNPNIPVLGGAGRVFVLESNGSKASLRANGTVDEVRQDIETFLEGGREAFDKRSKIYGIT